VRDGPESTDRNGAIVGDRILEPHRAQTSEPAAGFSDELLDGFGLVGGMPVNDEVDRPGGVCQQRQTELTAET
jgi:hypothetical protein